MTLESNIKARRPTEEGGVWGSYIDYLAALEAEVMGLRIAVDTLSVQRQEAVTERDHAREEQHRLAELFRTTRGERDEAREGVVRLGKITEKQTAELERLRTIIGELGAAEAAEPEPELGRAITEAELIADRKAIDPEQFRRESLGEWPDVKPLCYGGRSCVNTDEAHWTLYDHGGAAEPLDGEPNG